MPETNRTPGHEPPGAQGGTASQVPHNDSPATPSSWDVFEPGRDLEWEVTHTKSRIYKGRGNTPQTALRDLHDSFAKGVDAAREDVEREQKRLDKLTTLLGDAEEAML